MRTPEPCMCGAPDCPDCGRAMGTYWAETHYCPECDHKVADCTCEEQCEEGISKEERDDYWLEMKADEDREHAAMTGYYDDDLPF